LRVRADLVQAWTDDECALRWDGKHEVNRDASNGLLADFFDVEGLAMAGKMP